MKRPHHLALVSYFLGRLIGAALALAPVGFETYGQDLEPRAFANTPGVGRYRKFRRIYYRLLKETYRLRRSAQ